MNSSLMAQNQTAQNQTAFMNSSTASIQAAFSSPIPRGKRRARTPLRHRKVLRNNLDGISKSDIRRLARRGGVKRMSQEMYHETRDILKQYIQRIIGTALVYTEYASRKTVTVYDIIHALKYEGRTLFGYERVNASRSISHRRIATTAPPAPPAPRNTTSESVIADPKAPTKRPRIATSAPPVPRDIISESTVTEPQANTSEVDMNSQAKSTIRERIVSRKDSC